MLIRMGINRIFQRGEGWVLPLVVLVVIHPRRSIIVLLTVSHP